MTAEILSQNGLSNASTIVEAAVAAGLPLHIAAAMVEKESGGLNVYGNDRFTNSAGTLVLGVYAVGDPARPNPNVVTEQNYKIFESRVLAGETSNGVGPTQITWPGFIRDAKDRGIRLWDVRENMLYGMRLLAGYLNGSYTDTSIIAAGKRYNGAEAYGIDLLRRANIWKERLTKEVVSMVSPIGWNAISEPGTRRVGPHSASSDNPREIAFRNTATGDLMAATMWLSHTGNGGQFPDCLITQWHGLRPLNADFGVTNSDHHGGVATDQNWSQHPWEQRTGIAGYNAHMADPAYSVQHKIFAAVEARLTVPGQKPVVRWCGRTWVTDKGWVYGANGWRDCMHWVIGTTDWTRINAAAAHLNTWFDVPKDVAEIKRYQNRAGVTADGVWGPGSIRGYRTLQKSLGVSQTGLPGDVATNRAWEKAQNTPLPTPTPAPTPVKPTPTPAPTPAPTPDPSVAEAVRPHRVAGANRQATARAIRKQASGLWTSSKVYLANEIDGIAAASCADGSVLYVRTGSETLHPETAAALKDRKVTKIVFCGSEDVLPDAQAYAALKTVGLV